MNGLKESATDYVRRLFERRLKVGRVPTSRPDWYFQIEALDPQPYPGGAQVRVRTWRHWSDALAKLNADTGEAMGFVVERLADPPTRLELTLEEALAAVAESQWITLPPDAELERFHHFEYAEHRRMALLEWSRVVDGIAVKGDFLRVVIHPVTHRIVEFGVKWRNLSLRPAAG
jgi:hypothetical protein